MPSHQGRFGRRDGRTRSYYYSSRGNSSSGDSSAGEGRAGGPRRWTAIGTGVVALAILGLGLGIASAQTGGSTAAASPGTIVCPTVADKLPAVPASAQAEVERNLALLNTQVNEANTRLANSVGQGGPAFVQNAILGPLQGKRASTIDRIAISIGRTSARPAGLESLATCRLDSAGAAGEAEPAQVPPADPTGGGSAAPPAAAAPGTISCPSVADKLPAIPAQAQAEVDRNLALLETQIAEANTRLANSVGQGGPAFVQNAILGPLEDKRTATINRIATAIGRNAVRPLGLAESLSTCSLSAG